MSDICPVCDKEFDSKELFHKHVGEHLNEPLIDEPIKNTDNVFSSEKIHSQIDLKKIFSEEKFEKLVKLKMEKITDDAEILKKQNFIEQIKKINRRNPFFYMPYFIKDFMNGISTNDIEHKYHILHWMDHRAVTHNTLTLKENRYSSRKYDDALELNLKIINWKNKYQELEDHCKFFKNELDELVFDNVLQAGIIFLLMDKKANGGEIINEIRRIKDHYDLYHFVDDSLANSFNKILEENLEERVDHILFGLKKEGVIKRAGIGSRKLITTFTIDKIKKYVLKELEYDGRIEYNILRNSIWSQFPGLRLIPKFGVTISALRELENEKQIHIEYQSSRKNDFVVFLNEDYQKINFNINEIEQNQNKIPFKGRKITPELFVNELLELEKGDFDDADDQVTRLAGLVLAESVKIQSPHEKINEFDFIIDIKNYQFRPDQMKAIVELDFKIDAEILHVKVMIDQSLSFEEYEKLKEKIPQNEQGLIITFKKIPISITQDIKNDRTIQIIDEEGIRTWASITPQIPARVNSISKISYDPLSKTENKIVKVNSVFYETGIALVSVFPEMNEETVLARTLEEIELVEAGVNDFNIFSENYLEFLRIIDQISEDDQFEAFFKNEIKQTECHLNDGYTITFENHTVTFEPDQNQLNDILNCSCLQWIENKSKLCTHLITSLDWVIRNSKSLDGTWNNGYNSMRHTIELFLEYNISRNLDNLLYEIDSNRKLLKVNDKNIHDNDEKELLLDFISKIIKS